MVYRNIKTSILKEKLLYQDEYINVETKGSIIDDNSDKVSTVSKHKKDILDKKSDPDFKKKYNYNIDTCLGIITVADKKSQLQSWLVDPPFENFSITPEKLKLLKRLYYYYYLVRLLSKRSYITLTLANRIKTIELIEDYKSLDKLFLLNYNMGKVIVRDSFINSRTKNDKGSIVGQSILYNNRILYFIGLDTNILHMLVEQNFTEILNFKTSPNTRGEVITGGISYWDSDIKALFEKNKIKLLPSTSENYNYFQTEFEVIQNTAGLNVARKILR